MMFTSPMISYFRHYVLFHRPAIPLIVFHRIVLAYFPRILAGAHPHHHPPPVGGLLAPPNTPLRKEQGDRDPHYTLSTLTRLDRLPTSWMRPHVGTGQ